MCCKPVGSNKHRGNCENNTAPRKRNKGAQARIICQFMETWMIAMIWTRMFYWVFVDSQTESHYFLLLTRQWGVRVKELSPRVRCM